jgi:glyoxylase-like metal-dependent hydrolase (beta-lactamase superfamily II)
MENTYIIWDNENKETAVIDPGCLFDYEEQKLAGFIDDNKLQIKYLINTHCHIDHVFGNFFVKDKYNPEYYAPEKDLFLLDMMPEHSKNYGIVMKFSPKPDKFITEELELTIGKFKPRFLFTPGHTPGEYCIYFESENICIAGDVLFKESIGRTDLWDGDFDTLANSIQQKLYVLPEETIIYSGHGEETTIGHERKHNPFVN